MKFSLLLAFLFSIPAFAAKVATVKLVRGQANVVNGGNTIPLKLDDWVEEGAVIKTAEKSFVKLVFVDKSSMNVGPSSEMKIEQFNGKEAGVIDVVKGQIRSQVTKDYLQIQDPNKSKLFMKTKNAVMGVRGTDFMITTNGTNTATVLFEGEVVFNSLPDRAEHTPTAKLDDIVDHGVKVMPGEFSVVQADHPQPTVPSVMNLQQRETLEKNVNMESAERAPSNSAPEVTKSVVPDGLSGEAVSNSSENLKSEVASAAPAVEGPAPASAPAGGEAPKGDAAGFVNGDTIKPANGSFVHLESGTIIPPPAGSVLDPNTNSYIPAAGNGTVAADGSFVPPKGVEITVDGKILVTVEPESAGAAPKVVEIQKVSPVMVSSAASLSSVVTIINATPALQNSTAPIAAPTVATSTIPTTTTLTSPMQDRAISGTASPIENQVQRAVENISGTLNIEVIK